MRLLAILVIGFCCSSTFAALDISAIEQSAGTQGVWIPAEKVYKLSYPRDDVKVSVDGATIPPFMGLTSWASLLSGREKKAMVMGEIILFTDEVTPALTAAIDNGLEVTALNGHFFYDDPKVFVMHIGGEGTEAQLAAGVRKVMDAIKQVRAKSPQPATSSGKSPPPATSRISPKPLDAIFAAPGESKDGMYKLTLGREVTMPCACKAGSAMGVNTWAGFYGSDDHAVVEGDVACVYGEMQPVLKSLRAGGLEITAIHNRMEAEAPRMIFVHFHATGRAADLAKAIRATLDAQPQHPLHEHHHTE
jgi:hypothetical protein